MGKYGFWLQKACVQILLMTWILVNILNLSFGSKIEIFFNVCIYLKVEWQREGEKKYLPQAGSPVAVTAQWLWLPGLVQAKARSSSCSPTWMWGPRVLGPSSAAFLGVSTGAEDHHCDVVDKTTILTPPLPIQFPVNAPRKAVEDDPSTWAPDNHSSLLILAVVAIRGMN